MAYFLSTDFNGIDLLKNDRSISNCRTCNQPIRKYSAKVDIRVKAGVDFSCSRDGFFMVTEKFKRFYDISRFGGCDFLSLSSGEYVMMPKRHVELEFSPRVVDKSERCETCHQFTKFLAATHEAKIGTDEPSIGEDEFVRSLQETPMVVGCDFHLIVGEIVADVLKTSKMKQIIVESI